MKRFARWSCLIVVFAIVSAGDTIAQGSSDVWVEDLRVPQYFAVLVEDVDRSVGWYRTAFGLDELGGSVAEDRSWRIENLGDDRLLVEIIRAMIARKRSIAPEVSARSAFRFRMWNGWLIGWRRSPASAHAFSTLNVLVCASFSYGTRTETSFSCLRRWKMRSSAGQQVPGRPAAR